jgi:ABC-type phosphate transport system substrate-binding protein
VQTLPLSVPKKYSSYGSEKKQLDLMGDRDSSVTAAKGNSLVLAAVEGDASAIGFVDYGFAKDSTAAHIINIEYDGAEYVPTDATIQKSLAGTANTAGTTYCDKLTRPLNYLVKGTPSSVVKAFIDFAQSPGAIDDIESVGYIPYVNFA